MAEQPRIDQREAHALIRRRHEQRMTQPHYPRIEGDPELELAYRSLQLHWLRTCPAYRETVRQRVAEAARQAETRLNGNYQRDVDYLGREVDGCG